MRGDSIGLYGYAKNNPVLNIDPYGEFAIVGFAIGAGLELFNQYRQGGNSFDCLDVGRLAVAGATGALTGGTGLLARAALFGRIGVPLTRIGGKLSNAERALAGAGAVQAGAALVGFSELTNPDSGLRNLSNSVVPMSGTALEMMLDEIEEMDEDGSGEENCGSPNDGEQEQEVRDRPEESRCPNK